MVHSVEDVDKQEVLEIYRDYDPAIQRALEMIEHPLKRWPLLLTVCPTWTSKHKNMVLIGDAAHSMTNHMAQGAATSMEDGAFLGIVIAQVAKRKINLADALDVYEKERMPLADLKQQISFLNGLVYHAEDGSEGQRSRDEALQKELRGEYLVRSPNIYADPYTWRTVYGERHLNHSEMAVADLGIDYDPEAHAHRAIYKHVHERAERDGQTSVTPEQVRSRSQRLP